MIRRLFGLVRGAVVLGIIVYLLFFVQLGDKTAFKHLVNIWKTDEAQELKREAAAASKRVGGEIKKQIEEELPERFPIKGDARREEPGADGTPGANDTSAADPPK